MQTTTSTVTSIQALCAAIQVSRQAGGYISKREAAATGRKATCDAMVGQVKPTTEYPTEVVCTALTVLKWLAGQPASTDFMHACKSVMNRANLKPSMYAFVAGTYGAYLRAQHHNPTAAKAIPIDRAPLPGSTQADFVSGMEG